MKILKPFKSYLGEDTVYNFINSMIEEIKFRIDVLKKNFNKELTMTKEDDEDFKKSTKCRIFDNAYVDSDVKVRDHCHMTRKYRGSPRRDCNVNVKLNHKVPLVFCNLKNYDSHLIMQELGKSNFKLD